MDSRCDASFEVVFALACIKQLYPKKTSHVEEEAGAGLESYHQMSSPIGGEVEADGRTARGVEVGLYKDLREVLVNTTTKVVLGSVLNPWSQRPDDKTARGGESSQAHRRVVDNCCREELWHRIEEYGWAY